MFKLKLMLCAALGVVSVVAGPTPALAAVDRSAPVLVPGTFTFTPGTVDLTGGAGQVVVTAGITDATGAVAPVVTVSGPTTQSFSATMTRTGGTAQNGTYEGTVNLPTSAARGTWKVSLGALRDTLGHSDRTTHLNPDRLTVVNGTTDVAPPVLVPGSLTFTPSAVNVTTGPKQVAITARVSDAASGVVAPTVTVSSDTSTQAVHATMALDPGAPLPDTYQATVDIPTNAAPGAWTVSLDPLRDTVGNDDGTAHPNTTTKLNVSSGSADIAAPALVPGSFSFTPGTVDASWDLSTAGGADVVVTARLTDATGAEPPVARVSYDSTGQSPAGVTMSLVSGTPQDGTYEGTVSLPVTAAPGAWTVSLDPLRDPLGNTDNTVHKHLTKLTVLNEDALLPPAAPTTVVATRGDESAQVSWSAGAPNRSPITGYTVTASPGGATASATAPTTSATVPGLINGIAYTFTVKATNAIGTSSASAPSNAVTPGGRPAAPTGITAVRGHLSAQVSWAAAAPNGAPITEYLVAAHPGTATLRVSGSQTTGIVTGLANATAYTFTVTATNVVGSSPVSASSNAVTPAAVPGAPPAVTATRGDKTAQVTWTPAANNGFPITGYTVTASPGGATQSVGGTVTSAGFTGLTNGTAYTFTVTATNATGRSPLSAPSPAVTPAGAPKAPTAVAALRGDKSAAVSWPPAVNNGSAITGYTITASPGGVTKTVAGDLTTGVVTGLTNGTAYTFTVTATNAVGISPASAPSAPVTPAAVPAAPTGVTATRGERSADVSWTAPAANGSPITGYTITASPGGATKIVAGDQTTGTVTALTPGTSYTFTVTATSAVGTSLPSAPSNAVVPADLPGAPGAVTASPRNGSARVSWTAPVVDDVPVTGYTVTASPGGRTRTVGAKVRSTSITGLTNGTAYTFTVRAINAIGISPASAPSDTVIPTGPPGRVTSLKASSGRHLVTLRWTAPADNGAPITRYTIRSSSGRTITVAGEVRVARIKNLRPGTYKFTITAHSDLGDGPSSRAVRVVVR